MRFFTVPAKAEGTPPKPDLTSADSYVHLPCESLSSLLRAFVQNKVKSVDGTYMQHVVDYVDKRRAGTGIAGADHMVPLALAAYVAFNRNGCNTKQSTEVQRSSPRP